MVNVDLCRKKLLSDSNDGKRGKGTPNDNNDSGNGSDGNGDDNAQTPAETPVQKEYKRRMLSSLCNIPLDLLDEDAQPRGILNFGDGVSSDTNENNTGHPSPHPPKGTAREPTSPQAEASCPLGPVLRHCWARPHVRTA